MEKRRFFFQIKNKNFLQCWRTIKRFSTSPILFDLSSHRRVDNGNAPWVRFPLIDRHRSVVGALTRMEIRNRIRNKKEKLIVDGRANQLSMIDRWMKIEETILRCKVSNINHYRLILPSIFISFYRSFDPITSLFTFIFCRGYLTRSMNKNVSWLRRNKWDSE